MDQYIPLTKKQAWISISYVFYHQSFSEIQNLQWSVEKREKTKKKRVWANNELRSRLFRTKCFPLKRINTI